MWLVRMGPDLMERSWCSVSCLRARLGFPGSPEVRNLVPRDVGKGRWAAEA